MTRPRNAEEVAAIVAWARREGQPLVPRGAGTGMPGGNVGPGVILDTTLLAGCTLVEADRPTIRVGVGGTGARLRDAAIRIDAFVPALPSSAERCTVGGMAANNSAGARSFGYGATRRWVRAVEMVLPDGRPCRLCRGGGAPAPFDRALTTARDAVRQWGWPDVRKNSSGYALAAFAASGDALDLVVGSEGTLGVLTAVEFEVAPAPSSRAVFLIALPDHSSIGPAREAAERAGAAAVEFLGDRFLGLSGLRASSRWSDLLAAAAGAVLVELDDRVAWDDQALPLEEGMDRLGSWTRSEGFRVHAATTPVEREELWGLRHAASPMIASKSEQGLVSMQFIEDSVVPVAQTVHYLEFVSGLLETEQTDAVVFGHLGDGNLHVNPLIDVRDSLWRDRVARLLEATAVGVRDLGGTLAGEHGDGRIRAPLAPVVWGPERAEAFRTVQRTIDPDGIMNPGVVVALPGQDPLHGFSSHRRLS